MNWNPKVHIAPMPFYPPPIRMPLAVINPSAIQTQLCTRVNTKLMIPHTVPPNLFSQPFQKYGNAFAPIIPKNLTSAPVNDVNNDITYETPFLSVTCTPVKHINNIINYGIPLVQNPTLAPVNHINNVINFNIPLMSQNMCTCPFVHCINNSTGHEISCVPENVTCAPAKCTRFDYTTPFSNTNVSVDNVINDVSFKTSCEDNTDPNNTSSTSEGETTVYAGNNLNLYFNLPRELFPSARMFPIDPNVLIDEFCKLADIEDHAAWILDLEFGIPREATTRIIAIYNVKYNSIHCKNTPIAIHPGFESCDDGFKQALLFYYDCIISAWYRSYVIMNNDISVDNFQSWLQLPMQTFGMCWP
ncbi:uncharacterized protein [Battus philenor]|uniref:uncharacterized protein n=1 Tax=Battus philenor TaxID=42288 RepID=UPI0035D0C443